MAKIVIIDSGVDRAAFPGTKGCAVIAEPQGGYSISDDCQDRLGHGTAVCDIIHSNCQAEIFVFKVFHNSFQATPSELVAALDYICEKVDCELVLISAGVLVSKELPLIESAVGSLVEKGVIVVSAFDNDGALSYPASLDAVIGIDASSDNKKLSSYTFVENSPVNVIGAQINFRALWLNGKNTMIKGTSFTAAYFAALIANIISENDLIDGQKRKSAVMGYLKSNASKTLSFPKDGFRRPDCSITKQMGRIIAFPFSKEVHAIAKFEDLVASEHIEYYDVRQSGRVGLSIRAICPHVENDKTIGDFCKIDWQDDFDLMVLGHCDALNSILMRDVRDEVIEKCKLHQKKLYSFDNMDSDSPTIFSPRIDNSNVPTRNMGKLWQSGVPCVGVFGTSSRQGKFTLQMLLRRLFQQNGYKVRQISTEPSGYLFGCDFVYPMGYNSSVFVSGHSAVLALNDLVHGCEDAEADIVIVGSQSGTVTYDCGSVAQMPIPEYEFLLGTQPDYVVLCINPFDEADYISRTINFIESSVDCKVGACVMFPNDTRNGANSDFAAREFIALMRRKLNLPIFMLNSESDIQHLFKNIEEFFGGDENATE